MQLIDKLRNDLKVSLKGGKLTRATNIRTILGEINRSPLKDTSDTYIFNILKSLNKLAISIDPLKQDKEWVSLLQEYLPPVVADEEIIEFIKNNIDFTKLRNKNAAIGIVTKHYGSRVNGNDVKLIIEKFF